MESRKMALMNLFLGQKYEKQTSDLWAQGDGRRERVRLTVASTEPMYFADWAKAPARMKIHTIIMMLLWAAPREKRSTRSLKRRGRHTTKAQAQAAMKATVTGIL